MVMTTWLKKDDFTILDKDVAEWARSASSLPRKPIVEEMTFLRRSWFRRPKEYRLYSVYFELVKPEYQVINFASDNENFGISTEVDKATVLNFLIGFVNGVDSAMSSREETANETAG